MDDIRIITLDADADFARTWDLCRRAADYVTLETGRAPDDRFVRDTLTEAPPVCGQDDIFLYGLERADGTLAGIATGIRHYYATGDWYLGLLLLDPAARGAGLGTRAARHVMSQAAADGAPCLRIAVLEANPNARKFWDRLGFCLEKTVQGDPQGDGHTRHVLKLDLKGGNYASER